MSVIALTGAGVISPSGVGTAFLPRPDGLAAWGSSKLPDLDPADYGWKGLKRMSRAVKYGSLAVGEAFRSGGVETPLEGESSERTSLVVCSSHSNLEPIVAMYQDARQYGVGRVNPGLFPETVMNAFAGHLSIYFRITGTSVTLSDAVPSASSAFLYAADLLSSNQADSVMCCMLTLHPPSMMAHVTYHEEGGPGAESIVALLFRRVNDAGPSAAVLRWEAAETYTRNDCGPVVRPSDGFLAAASAYHGVVSGKIQEQHWTVSGRTDGYYSYCLTGPHNKGERVHA
ncbi:beta-ketoacyl synthase N-terminal-like domain-containing protein [Paenibacillus sambharensis]|uniref:beta-ketoacyl synthase N-terminal-like domain-containing protein n=1 Tax=Paenibacillus sambharensis TaxID=1803190 RepID=UPI0015E8B525|nr:beta-ketoacyl synthase N-terminal-like domain-containing protein [Paenibacillus sambharensis]